MIKLSLKTKIKGSWDFKQGLKPVRRDRNTGSVNLHMHVF